MEAAKKGQMERLAQYLLGNQVNDIRGVRYALYAAYTFGSGDYKLKDVRNTMKTVFKGTSGLPTIKRVLGGINELDDNLDLLSPEDIVNIGEVTLGSAPSPGLFHEMVPADLHSNAKKLAAMGVISEDEMYSFANLAAYFITEEARSAIEFDKTGDIKHRERLVECHMRQTEVTGAFVMHLFKRDKELKTFIENGGVLDYGVIEKHFPNLNRMCRLTQIKDDILDLYKDLLGEVETERAMPNVLLLEMDRAGSLYDVSGELTPDVRLLAELRNEFKTRLPVENLPEGFRDAFDEVVSSYLERAEAVSEPLRSLAKADLKRLMSDGIYITEDGQIEDNERHWYQVFAKRRKNDIQLEQPDVT